ncbi:MAG: nitroreductase family protein [Eubacteriales bacterium]|nr:nitroreductase family protein [Eubacteriales bacterium]
MNLIEAIQRRHSVRQYLDRPIPEEITLRLQAAIEACNRVGNLHMQLVLEEPEAFSGIRAKAMKFKGVQNYIIVAGEKDDTLDERCGYYGEKVVLLAQQLGLNTCWVGATYKKQPEFYTLEPGEKVIIAIAIGYGANQGKPRKSKSMCDVSDGTEVSLTVPDWYKRGVSAAMLAPTALNQQRFHFERIGNVVALEAGKGPFTKVDLGIVRCHFEIGAGKDNFQWMPEDE